MFGCVPSAIGKVSNEVLLKISQVLFTEPCILKLKNNICQVYEMFTLETKKTHMYATSHQCILVLPLWGQFPQLLQNRQDLEHY